MRSFVRSASRLYGCPCQLPLERCSIGYNMGSDDEEISPEWFLGVFIGIGATLAATLSKIYMKKSHMVEDDAEEANFISSPNVYLLLGILLLIVNTPMNFAAFALAPQSVVAATAGTASLFNMLLAPWLIDETRTR